MLSMMSNLKTKLIAGSIAAVMLANSAAPALAWGKDEQNIAKGALGVLMLGAIMRDADHHSRQNREREYREQYYNPPVYREPVYRQPVYQAPVYREPTYYQPQPRVYYQPVQSVYSTPAAQAFNSYSGNERLRIQATLANYGYYHGAVDGSFGPGTYQALTSYASQSGKTSMLATRGGAYGLMDGLLY